MTHLVPQRLGGDQSHLLDDVLVGVEVEGEPGTVLLDDHSRRLLDESTVLALTRPILLAVGSSARGLWLQRWKGKERGKLRLSNVGRPARRRGLMETGGAHRKAACSSHTKCIERDRRAEKNFEHRAIIERYRSARTGLLHCTRGLECRLGRYGVSDPTTRHET